MPRTHWLLAAAAALLLLVPSSAVSWPPAVRALVTGAKVSSAKVCGASGCREVSDPQVAKALAVGPFRASPSPERGRPWYKGTLTIPAEHGGELRAFIIVVPSAGLLSLDGGWVALPSESRAAYAKLTAGLTPRPARTLPGTFARVVEVVEPPRAATPASDGSNVWIVALGGGVLAVLVAGLLLWIRQRRASTPPAAPV